MIIANSIWTWVRRGVVPLLGVALAAGSVACGRPFDVKTAQGFVELREQQEQGYAYRATTPEGVVFAVRIVEDPEQADLEFWAKAVTLELREVQGYALLSDEAVTSADGTRGRRLRLARELDKETLDYWVSLYLAQGRLFVIESGARREQFEQAKAGVLAMEQSVKVRCGALLAPVLASRTCNRW